MCDSLIIELILCKVSGQALNVELIPRHLHQFHQKYSVLGWSYGTSSAPVMITKLTHPRNNGLFLHPIFNEADIIRKKLIKTHQGIGSVAQ